MIKGFIVSDHFDRFPAFLKDVTPLVRAGNIKYREDIADGLDAAPVGADRDVRGKELRQDAGARRAGSDVFRRRLQPRP